MQHGITMVIRSLTGGGAELIMTLMAKYWAEQGVRITLITSAPIASDAYTLHPDIKRVDLCLSRPNLVSRMGFPWDLRALRRAIRAAGNPIVLSFMDRSNIPVIAATRGLGVRVIVAEHIDPRPQNRPLRNRLLLRAFYPMADAITVLTENVKREWADRFLPPHKVHAIHNPVRQSDEIAPPPAWLPEKFICCMGRLHPQKGFERLFTILPEIFRQFPEYKLVILGEGTHRRELEEQRNALGLADRVLMPGFIHGPHNVLRRADLFVLSSRYEGFPNALLEAMHLRLPVVSFDCPSGPHYLINQGVDGVLVPAGDMGQLQDAICARLSDPVGSAAMGSAAQAKIEANCSMPKIMEYWEQLIESVLRGDAAMPIITRVLAPEMAGVLGR